MTDIANIVNLNISRQTQIPTVTGLSTIAIMTSEAEAVFGADENIRTYNTTDLLKQLTDDGFATTSETYKACATLAAQSPRPEQVKIITHRADVAKQVNILLGGGNVGQGDYTITLGGTEFTHNEPDNTRNLNDILTSIATLINANAAYSATVQVRGEFIQVEGPAGEDFTTVGTGPSGVTVTFLVTQPAVNAVSSVQTARDTDDDFYFLIPLQVSVTESMDLAAYIETGNKLLILQESSTFAYQSAVGESTSLLGMLDAKNYDRTLVLITKNLSDYKPVAWVAGRAIVQPGSSTWKFKTGRAITPDIFTVNQTKNIEDKSGNVFVPVGGTGINIFQDGVVVSGEYIDIMRGTDALTGRIQQLIMTQLQSQEKVPFTDGGIESVGLQLERALSEYVDYGLLVGIDSVDSDGNSLGPAVTVPTRAETSASDRSKRELNGITFTANYAGAIHKTTINGTISI